MDNVLCDDSPIAGRPKLVWPNDARVAFYIGLSVEYIEADKLASICATTVCG